MLVIGPGEVCHRRCNVSKYGKNKDASRTKWRLAECAPGDLTTVDKETVMPHVGTDSTGQAS